MERVVRAGPTGLDDYAVGWANPMDGPGGTTTSSPPTPLRPGRAARWAGSCSSTGSTQRNAFLNAPWVEAVVPIRPGKELAALNWLSDPSIEGAEGLDDGYQPGSADESTRVLVRLRPTRGRTRRW